MRKNLKRIFLTLGILLAVVVATAMLMVPALEIYRPSTDPEIAQWMSEVDDDKPLNELMLAGTHNSAAQYGNLGFFTKCQWTGIGEQLKMGYRVLDIRLKAENGRLITAHSIDNCMTEAWPTGETLSMNHVLQEISRFLDAYPSETVVMITKKEEGNETSGEFDEMLRRELAAFPERQLYSGCTFPTMGEARGKLVFVRRYSGRNETPAEWPAVYWSDQANAVGAESNEWNGMTLLVQDAYHLNRENKWDAVQQMLLEPTDAQVRLNYVSTAGTFTVGHPYTYADDLNRKLLQMDFEQAAPQWVMVDFAEREIARKLIFFNEGINYRVAETDEHLDMPQAIFLYLKKNFAMVLMIVCMLIVFLQQSTVGRTNVKSIRAALYFVLALSIVDFLEQRLRAGEVYSWWRVFFSVVGYSLRPTVAACLATMVSPRKKSWMIVESVALIVNMLIYATALFGSGIAFQYTSENGFDRGPLGYSSHIFAFAFVIAAMAFTVHYVKTKRWNESLPVYIMAASCIVAAVLETTMDFEVINICSVACCVFFYLHLHLQASSHDVTGLLNRQSYYNDCIRYNNHITAEMLIDMNGLKYLNDNFGHQAGDAGLQALANCFAAVENKHVFAYRVGGDEFVILCMDTNEGQMRQLVDKVREKVATTDYTCSIGWAMRRPGQTLGEMNHNADIGMYHEKAAYYAVSGHERRHR